MGKPSRLGRLVRRRRKGVALAWLFFSMVALIAAQLAGAGPATATSGTAGGTNPSSSSSGGSGAQPGSAVASATVLGVVPALSNLTLTVNVGNATAAFNQNEAQASSEVVNPGGLGLLLANTAVCGKTLVTNSQLPQPLTADSSSGPTSASSDGNVLGVGSESVSAVASPESATATTAPVSISLGGLAEVMAKSTSLVSYASDGEQQATATSTEDISLLGGLVELNGLTWTASQQNGTVNATTGSFSLSSVTISSLGVKQTIPGTTSLPTLFDEINKVTQVVGLTFSAPTVVHNPDGSVSVGPLDIRVKGSALDNLLLTPVNRVWQTVAQDLTTGSSTGPCQTIQDVIDQSAPSFETVVNVVLGVASGAGALDLDLGGATAQTSAAVDYANPFGSGGFSPPLPSASSGSLPSGLTSPDSGSSTIAPTSSPVSSSPTGSFAPVSAPTGTVTAPRAASSTQTVPANTTGLIRCVTTSPANRPSCWSGIGTVAAVIGLALGAGAMALDIASTRRRRPRRLTTGAGHG